ncbi:PH-like domain-containing protein [Cellulomonas citrea]|uniref:PH-like domain-containing protein n=1 Tax=Cellulomonas citrea TaxID=1909423 RepID=UPI00135786BF|nr:hypothetical protein [Cellulomonas citrea]
MTWAVSVAVIALVVAAALWGMRQGWSARGRASAAALPVLPDVPADLGTSATGLMPGIYVSTVLAADVLERVVAHGMGARSQAAVQVFDTGVRIARSGAPELFVPRTLLRAVATSGGQAGKFTGGDGLTVLEWVPPSPPDGAPLAPLRTAVRLRHAADRERLLATAGALLDPDEKETA